MAEYGTIINEISTSDGLLHKINADTLDGHHYSEIIEHVAGATETFVVTQSGAPWNDLSAASISVTLASLASYCGVTTSELKQGDVVLNTTTDIPDWWISKISGTDVYLSQLETQGVNHAHTLPGLSTPTMDINGVTSVTRDTVAKVGTDVTVATGALTAGNWVSGATVATSYTKGSLTGSVSGVLKTATSTATGAVSHTHTLGAHSHSVTYSKAEADKTFSAVVSLGTTNINNHTHASKTVAGAPSDATAITYVSKGTTTPVVKGLTLTSTSAESTGGASSSTTDSKGDHTHTIAASTVVVAVGTTTGGASTATTSTQDSHNHSIAANTFVSKVEATTGTASGSTAGAGSNTGWVTALSTTTFETGSSTPTGSFTNGTTSSNVVKGVTFDGTSTNGYKYLTNVTANAVSSFTASVNNGGVLSFSAPVSNVASPTASYMHISSGAVGVTGTVTVGAHTHNMNHKHTVDSHSHGLNSHTHSVSVTMNSAVNTASAGSHSHTLSHTHGVTVTLNSEAIETSTSGSHNHSMTHTHTYKSVVASGTADAYTGLTTTTYTPHIHAANVTAADYVAGATVSPYTSITSTLPAVSTLKQTGTAATVGNSTPTIGEAWLSVSVSNGNLAQGADTITWASLATSSVTPAATGLTVVTSVSYAKSSPIKSVSYTTIGTTKTGGKTTI